MGKIIIIVRTLESIRAVIDRMTKLFVAVVSVVRGRPSFADNRISKRSRKVPPMYSGGRVGCVVGR